LSLFLISAVIIQRRFLDVHIIFSENIEILTLLTDERFFRKFYNTQKALIFNIFQLQGYFDAIIPQNRHDR